MTDTKSVSRRNSVEPTAANAGSPRLEPLRVLHVSSGNRYGGVETFLNTLASLRHLCPEMEPSFALSYQGRQSRELAATGAPVYALGEVQVRRFWTVWRGRRRLRELLREQHFDLVICHMSWNQAIFGPAVRASGVPLVFYLHSPTEGRQWLERWARIAATPDLSLCVSRNTAETVRLIYPETPSEVIYSPLPPDAARNFGNDRPAVRAELETSNQATVIIQVSRMESCKGHSLLLEGLSRLRQKNDWTCWIVGGAQTAEEVAYEANLKQQTEQLGLTSRVRFLGQRSDVPRLLGAADIFCQPNKGPEGFSIVFMEAFLASLPIVTTAIGGALEMVDNSCGVLLPWNDLEALTEALSRLIDDRRLCRELGRAGYQRVNERCDPETQIRKLHGVFSSLAKANRSGSAQDAKSEAPV